MMNKLNFNEETPTFENGDFKWFLCKYFQQYLTNEQADNLPKLENLGCFIVKNKEIEDYVLIDNNQNVIVGYTYTYGGHEQMEHMINIIKINEHYDKEE